MFRFAVTPVLDLVRASVAAALTGQSEPPWSVPLTFELSPWASDLSALPLTFVEVRELAVDRSAGPRSIGLQLDMSIHHVRQRAVGVAAEAECLARLGAVAAAFENDPHLALNGGDTIPIHAATAEGIHVGTGSRIINQLASSGQDVGLAAASLDLRVIWFEGTDS